MKIKNERGAGRKPLAHNKRRERVAITLPPEMVVAIKGNKSQFIESAIAMKLILTEE